MSAVTVRTVERGTPALAPEPAPGQKVVYAISQHREGEGGGFDWYPATVDRAALDAAFDAEVACWADTTGAPCTVRLVAVCVPEHLTGEALTDWLDADIDALEHSLPPLRQAMSPASTAAEGVER